ncbi:MAG: hypothetical protein AAF675_12970 [Pseudomonadota bacterium]
MSGPQSFTVPIAPWPRGIGFEDALSEVFAAAGDDGFPGLYRVAGIEAWVAAADAQGAMRIALPMAPLLEQRETLDVHRSRLPLSVKGAKALALFAASPPAGLQPSDVAALASASGFSAVREAGYPDRLFLMPALVAFTYEDAAETLTALADDRVAAETAARRLCSAVRMPGATGSALERDLSVIEQVIDGDLGGGQVLLVPA